MRHGNVSTDERTIVPGIWSDAFIGLLEQGKARVKVQLVGENGEPISDEIVSSLSGIELRINTNLGPRLDEIKEQLEKINLYLQEIVETEIDNGDI